jgi:hypothetical protein
MPPSYGSQEYWNNRFTSETEPFEWLEAPHVLDPFLVDKLTTDDNSHPKLLHIGCGTSRLSYHLRTIVKAPQQIHNLDYSEVAINLGQQREKELYTNEQTIENTTGTFMRWDAVNLLDHKSFLGACKPDTYSIIVDKSTSDSIACSDDVFIPLPYPIDNRPNEPINLDLREAPEPIHPLHVMAVHLALATKPGALWIALSYSNDRFPFVDGLYSSRPHISGFPDTGTLWKLLDKREVENTEQQSATANDVNTIIHRPKVSHWVYILQRTDVPLFVRGAHL